jgi:Heme/copper-type cytochrome/quinol oxidase, subunit 3
VHSLRHDRPGRAGLFILATIGFAFAFLVVKAIEWSAKFEHGLYPNAHTLLTRPKGEVLYFGLYFMMTGLHALHVIAGAGVLLFAFVWIKRGRVTRDHTILLENAGLFWHLVDIIWIFLFPLFYLIT